MATRIVIEFEGTDYTVEFNRRTADMAEREFGISATDINEGSILRMVELLYCGLRMHHPKMKLSTAERIWESIPGKAEGDEPFVGTLIGMYVETVASMLEEPEEGKASAWRIVK